VGGVDVSERTDISDDATPSKKAWSKPTLRSASVKKLTMGAQRGTGGDRFGAS